MSLFHLHSLFQFLIDLSVCCFFGAMLGLCCRAGGLHVAVFGFLIVEPGFQAPGLGSCGSQAPEHSLNS